MISFYNNRNRGVTLIEALASITLFMFVIAQFILVLNNKRAEDREAAFAQDLSKIFYAFDRRIAKDGFDSTLWSTTDWPDINTLRNDLFPLQFIASGNPVCGDAANGWTPLAPDSLDTMLIPCNFYAQKQFPYDIVPSATLELDAGLEINRAVFTIEFPNANVARDNFNSILGVINKTRAVLPIGLSGTFFFEYWDGGSNVPYANSVECYNNIANCEIRAVVDFTGTNLNDVYLRVDGQNQMKAPVDFEDNAGNIQMCDRWENTSGTQDGWTITPFACGIIGGEGEDEVQIAVDVATAEEFVLDETCDMLNDGTINNPNVLLYDTDVGTFDPFGTSEQLDAGSSRLTIPCGFHKTIPDVGGEFDPVGSTLVTRNLSADYAKFDDVASRTVRTKRYYGEKLFLFQDNAAWHTAPNIKLSPTPDINAPGYSPYVVIHGMNQSSGTDDSMNAGPSNFMGTGLTLKSDGITGTNVLNLTVDSKDASVVDHKIYIGGRTRSSANKMSMLEFGNNPAPDQQIDIYMTSENKFVAVEDRSLDRSRNKQQLHDSLTIEVTEDPATMISRTTGVTAQPGQARVRTTNGFVHEGNEFSAISTMGNTEGSPDQNMPGGGVLTSEERRLHVTKDYIDSTIRLYEMVLVGDGSVIEKPVAACAPYQPLILLTPISSFTYAYSPFNGGGVSDCFGSPAYYTYFQALDENSSENNTTNAGSGTSNQEASRDGYLRPPSCDKANNQLVYYTYAASSGADWIIRTRLAGYGGQVVFNGQNTVAQIFCDKIR